MKNKHRQWVIAGSVALICGGLATAAIGKSTGQTSKATASSLNLAVDSSPLDRAEGLANSYAPVVKKAAPAVVNIFTTRKIDRANLPDFGPFSQNPMWRRFFGDPSPGGQPRRQAPLTQQSLGSGVVVTPDGYLVTNNHVVDGADEIKVAFEKSRKEYDAEVVGRDPQTDIALLKIDADDLPAAPFADSDQAEVGDVVIAIGNPFGVGQTVTLGMVSAIDRGGMGIEDYEAFIQTDAAINPGNSGGALIDTRGRLVGINTAILSRTGGNHGVGFAIPANQVRAVLDQLMAHGSVQRGLLGVRIQDLTPALAEEFGVADPNGALVAEVTPESAADQAGIRQGDVIIEFNGKPVNDSRSLRMAVGQTQPETEVELQLVRDGEKRNLTARLQSLPEDPQLARSREASPDRDEGALRGVGVGDLTREVREQLELPEQLEGAVITAVDPESPSYRAGLRPGDVILEIDRTRVTDAGEAVEACRQSTDGRTLVNVWRQGAHRYLVVKEES